MSDRGELGPQVDFDVLVVGAGGAGLAAAISAMERGASVVVADGAGRVGGSTARSGGSFMAVGTDAQRELGLSDSPDRFFDHYLTFNRWVCDPAVARRFCDAGWPTMQWLIAKGVSYPASGLYRAAREDVPRSHRADGRGQGLVDALYRAARSAGVEFALGNRVERLVVQDERVAGVVARGEELLAGAVVLASGGFAHNPELVGRYYPSFAATEGSFSPSAETNVGDGLLMGEAVGASIANFNRGVATVTPGFNKDRDPFPPRWLVYVNRHGRRFMDESAPYTVVGGIFSHQPGGVVFNVFDEETRLHGEGSNGVDPSRGVWTPELIEEAANLGKIARASSIESLALTAGIDPAGLEATVRRYNDDCGSSFDSQFRKDPRGLRPIIHPPFYAARVQPRSMSLTTAGVEIDPDGRVLDRHGQGIRGLFAAGEVVGNLIGSQYMGGGNSVGGALVFGRLAGLAASAEALAFGTGH